MSTFPPTGPTGPTGPFDPDPTQPTTDPIGPDPGPGPMVDPPARQQSWWDKVRAWFKALLG